MKVTLNGSASSDAIENGQQISGVGGQYNFVAMAHELPDARSVLQLRSVRTNSKGELESNIVFNYRNCTIPRHLRDVVISEYGIADLRGKTDEEVAIALIQIADSRFQDSLIQEAQKAHKVPRGFKLSSQFKRNTPESYHGKMLDWKNKGFFKGFPFGTDLTEEEITIGRALKKLKKLRTNKMKMFVVILKSYLQKSANKQEIKLLERMNLAAPNNSSEKLYSRLLLYALRNQ